MTADEKREKVYLCCPECDSHEVQQRMWVMINTQEICDEGGGHMWCRTCEDEGRDGTIGENEALRVLKWPDTREGRQDLRRDRKIKKDPDRNCNE